MDDETRELLERLYELDRKIPGPCPGCFLHCDPRLGSLDHSRPYQCKELLRRWAIRHKLSAGLYEEER